MPCYERDEVQDPLQRSGQTVDQALHSYSKRTDSAWVSLA